MSIERTTQELIKLIKETPEYNNAKSVRNRILQDSRLTKIVNNFQMEQAQLYKRNLPPNQTEAEMKKLVESFERLSSNTIIKDYATAMQQVQSIVYQINMSIIESVDKDLSI